MKAELRLEKIEKSMSGVKFAHINLTFDMEDVESGYAEKEWKLQCTGMAIVVKGEHNIHTLQWLMNEFKNTDLESKIDKFANDMIKANDLLNTAREVA